MASSITASMMATPCWGYVNGSISAKEVIGSERCSGCCPAIASSSVGKKASQSGKQSPSFRGLVGNGASAVEAEVWTHGQRGLGRLSNSRNQGARQMAARCTSETGSTEDSPVATSSELNRRVARQRFVEEVSFSRADADINLAKAALLLSAEDEAMAYIERERDLAAARREGRTPPSLPNPVKTLGPDPDASGLPLGGATLAKWLARLNLIAREVETLLQMQGDGSGSRYPLKVLKAVNTVLYDAQGYRGMTKMGDPRNSHLHLVLQRGIGTPVMLSIIYMEVCKRLDIPMAGTPLDEDYFMTWPLVEGMQMIFDAYRCGESYFWDEVKDLYVHFLPQGAAWQAPLIANPEAPEPLLAGPSPTDFITNNHLKSLLFPPPALDTNHGSAASVSSSRTSVGPTGEGVPSVLTTAGRTGGGVPQERKESKVGVPTMGDNRMSSQEGGVSAWTSYLADGGAEGTSLPSYAADLQGPKGVLMGSGVPVRPASNRDILACVLKTLRGIHWARAIKSCPEMSLHGPLLPFTPLYSSGIDLEQDDSFRGGLRPQDALLALTASERLVILLPNEWNVRREHGLLLYHNNRYAEAIKELQKSIELAPQAEGSMIQPLVDRITLMILEERWTAQETESSAANEQQQ
eukprot:TRINITY_DN1783_c0_g1_i1.p1 TRINITY_DN1783_c0_g1~~TRINITY_DN1783_c0_g1_i1.p1  ORF type:complete len:636 (-),score=116.41 TRINITY_DN1783_c0_g1_i1:619-2526(-)